MAIAPFIGQKITQACQEKRPKLSAVTIERTEIAFLQKSLKKRLGEILCRMAVIPAAANMCVEGIPISAAEALQRNVCLRRRSVGRHEDNGPVGRSEPR